MDQKEKILIVDDNEGMRKTLALIFSKKGYETETAGTGQEGLKKGKERYFHLALLDIKLPDMNGVELLISLKEMHPHMSVIMMTAYASVENVIEALNQGASGYLTKPLNMDEVRAIVREALEKQRLIREKMAAEEDLRRANRKILEQQEKIVEEERLKVLLQMAGATAHEMNQPLTALLASIDLLAFYKDDPEELAEKLDIIRDAGKRLADAVKKIRNIRHFKTKAYVGNTKIIDIDQDG